MTDAHDSLYKKQLRSLPSVSAFLESPAGTTLCETYGEGLVKWGLHDILASLRVDLKKDSGKSKIDLASIADRVAEMLRPLGDPAAREAVNGTGILLHTGLGRAPLPHAACQAMQAASGYTPVQTDLRTGTRSRREARIESLLCELTGCEAATVVNNNAAATMLMLNALAKGREVVISRGQLVEIGGAFRMPDVMERSGVLMREIGATNRTHLRNYEEVISEETAALLHVHTSNYRVRGFQGTPTVRELAPLAHQHGLLMLDDLGSGALTNLSAWGLPDEPLVRDSIRAGADAVCFSGDKLIGGPQCGIILGTHTALAKIRNNPFMRMFRVDKLTLAGLEATLAIWVRGTFCTDIPFYEMLARKTSDLESLANHYAAQLSELPGLTVKTTPSQVYIGSGSIPDESVPSIALQLRGANTEDIARTLRLSCIFGRIHDDAVLIDLRTCLSHHLESLPRLIRAAWERT